MTPTDPVTAPAIGFSLSIQLTPGKSLVLQSHVDGTATEEQLNAALDKIVKAGDRIDDHYTIPLIEKQIEIDERMLKGIASDLVKFDKSTEMEQEAWRATGKRGEYKPRADNAGKRQQMVTQIEELQERIKLQKAAYEKKRVLVYGNDGGADSNAGVPDS